MDMKACERDRPVVDIVDIEGNSTADDRAIGIAVHFGRNPTGSRSGGRRNWWDFVRRRHVRLEVIRLLHELLTDDAAHEHCRVKVYVVELRILHQASERIEIR